MVKEQPRNNNCNTDCPVPGKVNPQATALNYAVKFTSHHYFWLWLYYCWNNNMESTSWNWTFGESWCTWAGSICGENNRRNSGGYWRRGHFIWPWSNYCADHCQDYWANTVHCWKKTKTQLNRGAAKAKIAETQNATRSEHVVSKGETEVQKSGRKLFLPEPESVSELPRLKHMS